MYAADDKWNPGLSLYNQANSHYETAVEAYASGNYYTCSYMADQARSKYNYLVPTYWAGVDPDGAYELYLQAQSAWDDAMDVKDWADNN